MNNNKKSRDIPSFVFASCRTWHRSSFDLIRKDTSAEWRYVSNTIELEEAVSSIRPKYIFFVHWNWMVPESIWGMYECVCFHMTDVPYGRGGSPLQNLILAGHTQTKLTALRMVGEMDAGPVYGKLPLSLDGSAEEIYLRAGRLSLEMIKWIIDTNPQPVAQEGEIEIFKRRHPEQSVLPKNGDLKNVYDFIRMLDAEGYPNACVEHGDYQINFRNANLNLDRVIAQVEIKLRNKI